MLKTVVDERDVKDRKGPKNFSQEKPAPRKLSQENLAKKT
jgi:hypothetical protein